MEVTADNKDLFILSILSLVTFEIFKAYESNAPTLAVCRAAENSTEKKDVLTQIRDTDILIGMSVLVIGGTFAYHSKLPQVLLLPAFIVLGLSLQRRIVVESHSTSTPR